MSSTPCCGTVDKNGEIGDDCGGDYEYAYVIRMMVMIMMLQKIIMMMIVMILITTAETTILITMIIILIIITIIIVIILPTINMNIVIYSKFLGGQGRACAYAGPFTKWEKTSYIHFLFYKRKQMYPNTSHYRRILHMSK